jgi:phage regulator Rha-like protein
MDGEWNAVIDWPHSDLLKDIIEIKQEGNKFVGVFLKGNEIKGTGVEVIKGELEKNGFISLSVNTPDGWLPAKWKIDSDCNKIETKTMTTAKSFEQTLGLTLTRK